VTYTILVNPFMLRGDSKNNPSRVNQNIVKSSGISERFLSFIKCQFPMLDLRNKYFTISYNFSQILDFLKNNFICFNLIHIFIFTSIVFYM